jgi:hypothetical protein
MVHDAFNQRHPFMFKIKYIKEHVEELIKRGELDLAMNHIDIIRTKYNEAIVLNQIPRKKSFAYQHVQRYWVEEADLRRLGKTYPDGSSEKVIYALNELKRKITYKQNSQRIENPVRNRAQSKKDGATIDRLALRLYFTNPHQYNHDFEEIAKDHNFKNGEKLKKTFSILTKQIRRNGNCRELESQIQKLNRIEEYKWAIERLPDDKKQMAIDEMKTLESRLTVEE